MFKDYLLNKQQSINYFFFSHPFSDLMLYDENSGKIRMLPMLSEMAKKIEEIPDALTGEKIPEAKIDMITTPHHFNWDDITYLYHFRPKHWSAAIANRYNKVIFDYDLYVRQKSIVGAIESRTDLRSEENSIKRAHRLWLACMPIEQSKNLDRHRSLNAQIDAAIRELNKPLGEIQPAARQKLLSDKGSLFFFPFQLAREVEKGLPLKVEKGNNPVKGSGQTNLGNIPRETWSVNHACRNVLFYRLLEHFGFDPAKWSVVRVTDQGGEEIAEKNLARERFYFVKSNIGKLHEYITKDIQDRIITRHDSSRESRQQYLQVGGTHALTLSGMMYRFLEKGQGQEQESSAVKSLKKTRVLATGYVGMSQEIASTALQKWREGILNGVFTPPDEEHISQLSQKIMRLQNKKDLSKPEQLELQQAIGEMEKERVRLQQAAREEQNHTKYQRMLNSVAMYDYDTRPGMHSFGGGKRREPATVFSRNPYSSTSLLQPNAANLISGASASKIEMRRLRAELKQLNKSYTQAEDDLALQARIGFEIRQKEDELKQLSGETSQSDSTYSPGLSVGPRGVKKICETLNSEREPAIKAYLTAVAHFGKMTEDDKVSISPADALLVNPDYVDESLQRPVFGIPLSSLGYANIADIAKKMNYEVVVKGDDVQRNFPVLKYVGEEGLLKRKKKVGVDVPFEVDSQAEVKGGEAKGETTQTPFLVPTATTHGENYDDWLDHKQMKEHLQRLKDSHVDEDLYRILSYFPPGDIKPAQCDDDISNMSISSIISQSQKQGVDPIDKIISCAQSQMANLERVGKDPPYDKPVKDLTLAQKRKLESIKLQISVYKAQISYYRHLKAIRDTRMGEYVRKAHAEGRDPNAEDWRKNGLPSVVQHYSDSVKEKLSVVPLWDDYDWLLMWAHPDYSSFYNERRTMAPQPSHNTKRMLISSDNAEEMWRKLKPYLGYLGSSTANMRSIRTPGGKATEEYDARAYVPVRGFAHLDEDQLLKVIDNLQERLKTTTDPIVRVSIQDKINRLIRSSAKAATEALRYVMERLDPAKTTPPEDISLSGFISAADSAYQYAEEYRDMILKKYHNIDVRDCDGEVGDSVKACEKSKKMVGHYATLVNNIQWQIKAITGSVINIVSAAIKTYGDYQALLGKLGESDQSVPSAVKALQNLLEKWTSLNNKEMQFNIERTKQMVTVTDSILPQNVISETTSEKEEMYRATMEENFRRLTIDRGKYFQFLEGIRRAMLVCQQIAKGGTFGITSDDPNYTIPNGPIAEALEECLRSKEDNIRDKKEADVIKENLDEVYEILEKYIMLNLGHGAFHEFVQALDGDDEIRKLEAGLSAWNEVKRLVRSYAECLIQQNIAGRGSRRAREKGANAATEDDPRVKRVVTCLRDLGLRVEQAAELFRKGFVVSSQAVQYRTQLEQLSASLGRIITESDKEEAMAEALQSALEQRSLEEAVEEVKQEEKELEDEGLIENINESGQLKKHRLRFRTKVRKEVITGELYYNVFSRLGFTNQESREASNLITNHIKHGAININPYKGFLEKIKEIKNSIDNLIKHKDVIDDEDVDRVFSDAQESLRKNIGFDPVAYRRSQVVDVMKYYAQEAIKADISNIEIKIINLTPVNANEKLSPDSIENIDDAIRIRGLQVNNQLLHDWITIWREFNFSIKKGHHKTFYASQAGYVDNLEKEQEKTKAYSDLVHGAEGMGLQNKPKLSEIPLHYHISTRMIADYILSFFSLDDAKHLGLDREEQKATKAHAVFYPFSPAEMPSKETIDKLNVPVIVQMHPHEVLWQVSEDEAIKQNKRWFLEYSKQNLITSLVTQLNACELLRDEYSQMIRSKQFHYHGNHTYIIALAPSPGSKRVKEWQQADFLSVLKNIMKRVVPIYNSSKSNEFCPLSVSDAKASRSVGGKKCKNKQCPYHSQLDFQRAANWSIDPLDRLVLEVFPQAEIDPKQEFSMKATRLMFAPATATAAAAAAAKPTTAKPTTAKPTTAKPTTAKPTTAKPTTAKPTTAKPTTAKPGPV